MQPERVSNIIDTLVEGAWDATHEFFFRKYSKAKIGNASSERLNHKRGFGKDQAFSYIEYFKHNKKMAHFPNLKTQDQRFHILSDILTHIPMSKDMSDEQSFAYIIDDTHKKANIKCSRFLTDPDLDTVNYSSFSLSMAVPPTSSNFCLIISTARMVSIMISPASTT